jgi:hypothetical protein
MSDDDALAATGSLSQVSDLQQLDLLQFPNFADLARNRIFLFAAIMDGTNSLDKFLPKSIAAKRRRRKQESIAETTSSNDEAGSVSGGVLDGAPGGRGEGAGSSASSTPRGRRSINSREQTAGTDNTSISARNSMLEKRTSNMTDEGSLVSYDSDTDL